jgi:hypothetical protein
VFNGLLPDSVESLAEIAIGIAQRIAVKVLLVLDAHASLFTGAIHLPKFARFIVARTRTNSRSRTFNGETQLTTTFAHE